MSYGDIYPGARTREQQLEFNSSVREPSFPVGGQGSRMAYAFCSQTYRQKPFFVAKFDSKKPRYTTEMRLKINC